MDIMDYELQLKVKNAPLLNLMRERGYKSPAELSRACGIQQSKLGEMINLKYTVFTRDGITPRVHAIKLARFFSVEVDDLFPPDRLYDPLVMNEFTTQVKADQLEQIANYAQDPSALLEQMEEDSRDVISDMLGSVKNLRARSKRVIEMRFAEDMTLEQCSIELGVSRARVRQIESTALRSMRHPLNKDKIKTAAGSSVNAFMNLSHE